MRRFTLIMLCFVVGALRWVEGQENPHALTLHRDSEGDMNADSVKQGAIAHSLRVAGMPVAFGAGGFIKSTAYYDTKYNRREEYLLPGNYSSATMDQGQFGIGARSSRLYFEGKALTEKGAEMKGYFEIDFRGASGITLRHAYLRIKNHRNFSLLMGQYWTNMMNLQTIPEGLVEPTMSGLPFYRHGQIRVVQGLGKRSQISFSVEEPSNADFSGANYTPYNQVPDFTAAFEMDPSPHVHFSLAALGRYCKIKDNTTALEHAQAGYLLVGSLILKNEHNKLILGGNAGAGASAYILGADPLASGYLTPTDFVLHQKVGFTSALRHLWSQRFRSNVGYGAYFGSPMSMNPDSHFKSSQYGFVNTYFRMNRFINIGVEWIYSSRTNTSGPVLENNRFQLGIQIF